MLGESITWGDELAIQLGAPEKQKPQLLGTGLTCRLDASLNNSQSGNILMVVPVEPRDC